MVLNFTGKSAVVTGGANGIGLAVAQALAKSGAQVWIFDLEREDPRAVAAGFGARACVADVTDRASLDAAFTQTGPPDILVANAGIVREADLTDTSREIWERTIAVNLTGIFQTVQAAAGMMNTRPMTG